MPERDEFSDDTLRQYRREVERYPLLSNEEQIATAIAAQAGDKAAWELMINSNLRLVWAVATRYRGRGLPMLDLLQAGNEGLMTAVEKFDPYRGFTFSTYATWWVRQAIGKMIKDEGRLIRLPLHIYEQLSALRTQTKELTQKLGREPSDEELAGYVGMRVSEIEKLKDLEAMHPASLDAPVGESGDTLLQDVLSRGGGRPADQALDRVGQESVRQDLFRVMQDKLDDQSFYILLKRFGFGESKPWLLDEVAYQTGLSKLRVRQIEVDALRKLRSEFSYEQLKEFADLVASVAAEEHSVGPEPAMPRFGPVMVSKRPARKKLPREPKPSGRVVSVPMTPIEGPLDYQKEPLRLISLSRRKGEKRAQLVMATGLGKTVVAALDAKTYRKKHPGKMLYLCHQIDILRQARRTFGAVLGYELKFGYLHGNAKLQEETDIVFATFQSMQLHRESFSPDEFAYIVVDESHHGPAETYRPTLEYFQPQFLLGITATPSRMDQQDIAELFGPPIIELSLERALVRKLLALPDYRLIVDDLIDRQMLETPARRLSMAQLNRSLFVPKRDVEIARLIREKCDEIESPRTIVFCASIFHCNRLEKLLPGATTLHSKIPHGEQNRRLWSFREGRAKTILTVDMFNEGIDIPEANVIVFLRSTASRTIFLQQLGRGLRKLEGKDKVLVLDFVANCQRMEMVYLLAESIQEAAEEEAEAAHRSIEEIDVPDIEFSETALKVVELIRVVKGRSEFSREVMLERLEKFCLELGRSAKVKEVNEHPDMPSVGSYRNMFGTFAHALKLAGFPKRRWSESDMLAEYRAFCDELGHPASSEEVNRNPNLPSATSYYHHFGSWPKVVVLAGLTPVKRSKTHAQLDADLRALCERLGRAPTVKEAKLETGMTSPNVYSKRFGSWAEALARVGYQPRRKRLSDEQLLDILRVRTWLLGRAPKMDEIDADPDLPNSTTFVKRFGGWSKAIEMANN